MNTLRSWKPPSKETSEVIAGAFDADEDDDNSVSLCLFRISASTSTNSEFMSASINKSITIYAFQPPFSSHSSYLSVPWG